MVDPTRGMVPEAARTYLARLVEELTRRGFRAESATSRTGVALIRVVNPEASVLNETVHCMKEPDGSLWLAWPWGKVIARADETAVAADVVARVLGTGRGIVADG